MRTRYKILEDNNLYFITCTIVAWIPVFTNKKYANIITEALSFYRSKEKLKLFAYVVMDNHIHLIISSNDTVSLMKNFKSFTASELLKTVGADNKDWLLNQFSYYKKRYKNESKYQVWQEGFHPKMITDPEILRQKIEYIHNNPVKRGMVIKPEDWVYSSAKNYLYGDGFVEVDLIEL